jgi:hypothetical protein
MEHLATTISLGGDPVFATFAVTGDVRARTEVAVGAGEPDQLGDPQPGLDGQVQHRVIAPTGPAGGVAGREQRLDLGFLHVLGDLGHRHTEPPPQVLRRLGHLLPIKRNAVCTNPGTLHSGPGHSPGVDARFG